MLYRLRKTRFSMMLTLICALVISSVIPIMASDNERELFTPTKVTPIYITSNSYIELKEAMLLPVKGANTVTYTVTFVNKDNYEIQFIDYWARLVSNSGTRYSLSILEEGNKIPPQSSVDFTFYTNVAANHHLNDLTFEIVRFDFSYPDYQRTLGTYKLPSNYTTVVPEEQAKAIHIEGNPVITGIEQYIAEQIGDYTSNYLAIKMENTGNRRITIPDYRFYLRTKTGIMYELDLRGLDDKTIQPKDNKLLELDADIPSSIDLEDSIIIIAATHGMYELPIAEFSLPESETVVSEPTDPDLSVGKEYTFKTSAGSYSIILNSIQRLPWEDEDIVAADITLKNIDSKSLPIPTFDGYFELDGVKLDNQSLKFVNLDLIHALTPEASTNVILYTKIPYTFVYDDMKLVLQARAHNSDAMRNVAELGHKSESLKLPLVRENQKYILDDIGRRAEIAIHNLHTYEGDTTDIFYVELEMTNLERRQTLLTRMMGYFKTKDDIFFPAEMMTTNDKVMPGEKVLLSFWSTLPKGYTMEDLQIVMGQGLSDASLAVGDQPMDAFMKAVSIQLPKEDTTVLSELRDLEFMPYNLSFRNIRNTLISHEGDTKGKIVFGYDLTEQKQYSIAPDGHKIVIEFVDEDVVYEKELDFDNDFVLGKHNGELLIDVHAILLRISGIDDYRLNIYDSFHGHKKLIASKVMNWYVTYE